MLIGILYVSNMGMGIMEKKPRSKPLNLNNPAVQSERPYEPWSCFCNYMKKRCDTCVNYKLVNDASHYKIREEYEQDSR